MKFGEIFFMISKKYGFLGFFWIFLNLKAAWSPSVFQTFNKNQESFAFFPFQNDLILKKKKTIEEELLKEPFQREGQFQSQLTYLNQTLVPPFSVKKTVLIDDGEGSFFLVESYFPRKRVGKDVFLLVADLFDQSETYVLGKDVFLRKGFPVLVIPSVYPSSLYQMSCLNLLDPYLEAHVLGRALGRFESDLFVPGDRLHFLGFGYGGKVVRHFDESYLSQISQGKRFLLSPWHQVQDSLLKIDEIIYTISPNEHHFQVSEFFRRNFTLSQLALNDKEPSCQVSRHFFGAMKLFQELDGERVVKAQELSCDSSYLYYLHSQDDFLNDQRKFLLDLAKKDQEEQSRHLFVQHASQMAYVISSSFWEGITEQALMEN